MTVVRFTDDHGVAIHRRAHLVLTFPDGEQRPCISAEHAASHLRGLGITKNDVYAIVSGRGCKRAAAMLAEAGFKLQLLPRWRH